MTADTRKIIQLILWAGLGLTVIRVGYIFYERHEDQLALEKKKQAEARGYSNPDYYVLPRKLHPYDLKTAQEITKQPAWVRVGYHFTYCAYQPATKHVDFAHSAGLLGPIEKLAITAVVVAANRPGADPRQVVAVFDKDGKPYAVPVGLESDDGSFKIYTDDIFFIEDPHDLYKHWPTDVWQAIDQHQVKLGMTEMQVVFAIGVGMLAAGSDSYSRTLSYPNGGKPLTIVYHDDKAVEITPATPSS